MPSKALEKGLLAVDGELVKPVVISVSLRISEYLGWEKSEDRAGLVHVREEYEA